MNDDRFKVYELKDGILEKNNENFNYRLSRIYWFSYFKVIFKKGHTVYG